MFLRDLGLGPPAADRNLCIWTTVYGGKERVSYHVCFPGMPEQLACCVLRADSSGDLVSLIWALYRSWRSGHHLISTASHLFSCSPAQMLCSKVLTTGTLVSLGPEAFSRTKGEH